jgi:acyl-CoA-dependent ceramide synthase
MEGLWMPWWFRWLMFVPLIMLQGLNLFWYNLILKVLWRGIVSREVDDSRSDDEDAAEDEKDD